MKNLLLTAAIVILGSISLSAQNKLTVVVPNVKQIKGTMMICLVSEKAEYLKDCYKGESIKVEAKSTTAVFQDVPTGKYAITIFHDKNSDGKLNTNFIGIPKEPYGFSNNPSALFGPPSYEKCLFEVKSDTTVSVEI